MDVREFKIKCLLHEHQQCLNYQNNYNNAKTTLRQFCITIWTVSVGYYFHLQEPLFILAIMLIVMTFWALNVIKDLYQSQNYIRLLEVENHLNKIYEYSEELIKSLETPKDHEKETDSLNIIRKIRIMLKTLNINTTFFFPSLIILSLIIYLIKKFY